jgi:hypothetical protein
MSQYYVVYHKDTTRLLCRHPKTKTKLEHFEGMAAAKSALTREVNRGAVQRADFLICTSLEFRRIEKTETVQNLMSGKDVVQGVNTPLCCDPSSETYWSM